MPPSVDDWVNEDHLARFVVEIVDGLDISNLIKQYAGRGSQAYNPATLLALIVYGYATGVFSSRKLERATYDSVAFRFIAANSHPDHDTLATFRRRFLAEIRTLFVQVLEMAKEMKLLQMGTVCLDGTKIHANASKHSALSHGHIIKLQAHLKKEVDELLAVSYTHLDVYKRQGQRLRAAAGTHHLLPANFSQLRTDQIKLQLVVIDQQDRLVIRSHGSAPVWQTTRSRRCPRPGPAKRAHANQR